MVSRLLSELSETDLSGSLAHLHQIRLSGSSVCILLLYHSVIPPSIKSLVISVGFRRCTLLSIASFSFLLAARHGRCTVHASEWNCAPINPGSHPEWRRPAHLPKRLISSKSASNCTAGVRLRCSASRSSRPVWVRLGRRVLTVPAPPTRTTGFPFDRFSRAPHRLAALSSRMHSSQDFRVC
ncbi:hypothetical protein CSUI_001524 [Cystoisospora suis]|uniref:Uncharacterized protein n=1 Tax=Cystoisospora suis TaxID=483139 RepID=A0A2C6KKQ1_9APIC|nr:hypothetical protein CSUI_001524 [Cystoisospora suis]